MDKLFKLQSDFTSGFILEKYGKKIEDLSSGEKVDLTKDYVLHLHQEISSILSNISYKMHRKPMEVPINNNVFEEIIDTIKFSMGLWVVLGKDWKQFEKAFHDKSEIVSWRMKQEKDLDRLAESGVAVLDIDGVLAQYPGPFLEFLREESGKTFPSISEARRELGIIEYDSLKTHYRTSGRKRDVPLVPGAKEFVDELSSRGFPIVFVSSRPYERHLNILSDTITWARNSGLQFDALYFDERKGLKIAKRFPNVKLVVDDDPSFIEDIRESVPPSRGDNLKIVLFDPSGRSTATRGTYVAKSFKEILNILED